MVKWIFFFFVFTSNLLWSQLDPRLIEAENKLSLYLEELRKASTDEEKELKNQQFKDSLKSLLALPESYSYPFKKLRSMGTISSPDGSFRLYTWNVEFEDFSHKYECLIHRFNDRKKEYQIIELEDNSLNQEERTQEVLEKNNWYGALYYQIIPFEKGNKDLYIVLGWDGFSSMSNRKILDVLYFTGNNVKLGSPVFKHGTEVLKRVYYEYAENANMSLRWDPTYQRIIMDHLSPESPNLKGFYAYYVPDMSYDAYTMEKGKWILQEDVIAVNPAAKEKIDIYVQDEDGNPVKKKLKNEWENPSDPNSPVGGNNHVAQLPQVSDKDPLSKPNKKKERKEKRKKKKEDKSNIYPLPKDKKR